MRFFSHLVTTSVFVCSTSLVASPLGHPVAPVVSSDASVAPPAVTPIAHPYPLDICIVSGDVLSKADKPITAMIDGREVRFCSKGCSTKYKRDAKAFTEKISTAIIEQQRMHYPINTCIVGKSELGSMGEPIELVYNNRLIRFCCGGCPPGFKANPDKYLKELDQMILESQIETYPLENCVVGGDKLGSMGEPVNIVYMNRLVRLCCAGCLPSFQEDPAPYMAKIDAAYADQQRADYPLENCVVGGDKLGSMGEPVEVVAGTQLVRLCCAGCLPRLKADPQKYIDKIKQAEK